MSQRVPVVYFQADDAYDTMYEYDYEYNPKVGLDGLTGVPTRTTSTLTPTTLRNIEQTFLDLQEQVSHQNQAGFVPPVVQTPAQDNHQARQPPVQGNLLMSLVDTKSWGGGCAVLGDSHSQSSNDSLTLSRSTASVTPPAPPTTTRRNTGGRRPNKVKNISPEEEERRYVRRERNKLAAARCRKRRLDHTNELVEETEGLEEKKMSLQNEIQQLQAEKDDLEYILEAHKTSCRLQRADSPPDVKPFLDDPVPVRVKEEPEPQRVTRPRPTSLQVPTQYDPRKMPCHVPTSQVAGVPITTPTAGMPFNFDSLMDGGTGLTPVTGGPMVPSCASQQRTGSIDLASPDTSKLVSL